MRPASVAAATTEGSKVCGLFGTGSPLATGNLGGRGGTRYLPPPAMDSLTASNPTEPGPLAAYRAMVSAGDLAQDASQAMAAERLQRLWAILRGYDPRPAPEASGLLSRLFRRRQPPAPAPHGLYLVGEVGRGKSMLMDLFFDTAEVARKQRIHF